MRYRIAALGLAVAVMGAFIALITFASEHQGAGLRTKLDQVDAESINIAEHFKDMVREGSDHLTHYRNLGDDASWQEFLKSGNDLNAWMQGQLQHAGTPRERDILTQMNAAYADYARVAAQVHEKVQTIGTQQNLPVDLSDSLSQTHRRLFDLGQDLSQAHLQLKQELLGEAHVMLDRLRRSVYGALALLFLFGAALAVFVYRDLIAPLRSKLVETQAIIDQQEKMASLGLLAAGVAHEIRNPLTAVKAALFTQQKRFAPGSPEHADVKIVEREISRLDKIVTDFLKFARPADPEMKPVPADLLLLEAKLFLTPQLERQNIRISQETTEPLHVKVDAAQIQQVLINLVQNAADSIGRDGTVTLRTRHTRKPLLNGSGGTVILEVTDTGKGIPPEVQRRIFDPFYTTKENGTGLGLSIAARIVEKHGGRLQFQSQVNHGSTFGILLPQVDA